MDDLFVIRNTTECAAMLASVCFLLDMAVIEWYLLNLMFVFNSHNFPPERIAV